MLESFGISQEGGTALRGGRGLSQTRVTRTIHILVGCPLGAAMLTPLISPLPRAESDTVHLQRGLPPTRASTAADVSLYNIQYVCMASFFSLEKSKVLLI